MKEPTWLVFSYWKTLMTFPKTLQIAAFLAAVATPALA